MSAGRRLRDLLARRRIGRLVGAHDALGARVAQETGFDGVWASGFELAASRCVPDAGILTMTEHLAAAEQMAWAVDIPVLADCDTGYGNAENAAYMVGRFEAAGVAGACIEDQQFPKLNSFAPHAHALVAVEEFADKVRRAKEAQHTDDFVLVARTEALIAGHGAREALRRAEAYARAGADAVLVHSREVVPDELFDVLRSWQGDTPLIAVPTTYHQVDAGELESLGVAAVIYANQGLRSALRAMRDAYATILASGSTTTLEGEIASVASILEISGTIDAGAHREAHDRA